MCGSICHTARVGALKEGTCGIDMSSDNAFSLRKRLRRPHDGLSHGPRASETRPCKNTKWTPPEPEYNLAGSNAIYPGASVTMAIATNSPAVDTAIDGTCTTYQLN